MTYLKIINIVPHRDQIKIYDPRKGYYEAHEPNHTYCCSSNAKTKPIIKWIIDSIESEIKILINLNYILENFVNSLKFLYNFVFEIYFIKEDTYINTLLI
jgi:hypothetical protein